MIVMMMMDHHLWLLCGLGTISDDNAHGEVDTDIEPGGAAVSPETVRYFLSLDMKV